MSMTTSVSVSVTGTTGRAETLRAGADPANAGTPSPAPATALFPQVAPDGPATSPRRRLDKVMAMSNEHPPAHNPYAQPAGQYGGDPAGQGGPYGPPVAMPGGAYPPPPAPGVFGAPPAGAPAAPYGVPGAYGVHPYPPAPAPVMPGSVRGAQIVSWVMAGLALLIVLVWGFGSGAEAAGRLMGANLMGWVLFFLSFRYPTAGNGVRIASIALASLQIAMSIGGLAQGNGGGGFPLIGAIVVVTLLNQRSAVQWFQRPRDMVGPYGR
ncbi:hypothetical protein ABZY42_18780 [Streptomyces sp. NPDC006622]|uniref:hypothetical protein n=1 Tax=Streptomyces sp. NPDC006622 TaxID=3155459 RepID=UPI0033AF4C75